MNQGTPFAPSSITDDQLIAEISDAEPDHLPPEVARRCLDLLAEIVVGQVAKGGSVEVANLGTFAPAGHGSILVFCDR